MKQYEISREGVFASTINHLMDICLEDEQRGQESLELILPMLIPETIKTKQDKATAHYIAVMAKMANLMELEAEMLNKLRPVLSDKDFSVLAQLDYTNIPKDNEFLYTFAPTLLDLMRNAGVESLEVGFAETAGLNQELRNDGVIEDA